MNATQTATTTAPATTSRLGAVKRGKINMPWRYLFYGPEGVGKSTLASGAPSPIWFDIEDGAGRIDTARYPFRDGEGGHVPRTYKEVLAAIDDLATAKHEYKTVVFDTVDRLESLIWKHILERDSRPCAMNKSGKTLTSIEEYGYGKGFALALDEWRDLCRRLDLLRARGISVILLAHASIKTYKNPQDEDYDRWSLRAHLGAAGFLKEWCDVVGFVTFEEWASKGLDGDGRAKGKGTGRRLLKTERTAAYDAKSRLALPKEIEIEIAAPWHPIAVAVEAVESATPATLLAEIAVELERLNDAELTTKVNAATAAVKSDTAALSRYLMALKAREATQPETSKEDQSNV